MIVVVIVINIIISLTNVTFLMIDSDVILKICWKGVVVTKSVIPRHYVAFCYDIFKLRLMQLRERKPTAINSIFMISLLYALQGYHLFFSLLKFKMNIILES